MKISIIIPFNKRKSFLEDALQSLYDQTYKDFEIILICDHVEENLDSLLTLYQNKLDLKIYSLHNKSGVAAARNYGLSLATGEYIYFLDSDDYLNQNTLELLSSVATTEHTEIIYGKTIKTWFKRHTFLSQSNYNQEESNDMEDIHFNTINRDISEQNILNQEVNTMINLQEKRKKAYRILVSNKKRIINISVLNILIKRSLIMKHNIKFKEDIVYLSDYPFLFQVLHHANSYSYVKEATYIKRNHNDPVNHPSLSQMYGSKDFKEFINTYLYTIELPQTNPDLRLILDQKILKYYTSSFAPKLHRNPNTSELAQQFHDLHSLIQHIDKKILKNHHGYQRRLLNALISGNLKKSISIVKFHLAFRKLKKIITNRKELTKALYVHVFLKMSVKENWVLCESFFGKSYSDNPKYIYEYLSLNYPDKYKFIWIVDNKQTDIPYQHKKVKRLGILYCYYLARCNYFVFNGRQPEWARKRNGTTFLQTWHGTPLKRLAFDMDDISSATARYKKQVYNQSRSWDYLIAPNRYSSDIFKNCFMYDKEMLESGYPRNDILHSKNKKQLAVSIKNKLGIPLNKKTILYAPTWRDDEFYAKGKYKFSLMLDLQMLKTYLSSDYIILLRTHYFIADNLDITGLDGFVYNVSNYDDIAQLYLISDILITDYSSVFFDYANLRRPMLFFMYDLDKYRDVLRGFYIDIEKELPGPILSSSEEVLKAIMNIDILQQNYYEKYTQFYNKYCSWENGNASARVVNKVFQRTDAI